MSTDFTERMSKSFTLARSALATKLTLLALVGVLIGAAVWVLADSPSAGAGTAFVIMAGVLAYGALGFNWLEQWIRQRADEHETAKNAPALATAAKENAIAEKFLAEADAIDRTSASAAQVNMNTGSGTMKVQNKPIAYNVAGNNVGQLTLNQINQIDQRKIEIPASDVRWMAEQLAGGYGHSKNKWVKEKVELPYSRQTVTWEIYKAVMDALVSAEPPAIIGRDERASGKLIEQDPAQLVKLIEQTHPGAGSKGLVITPPYPIGIDEIAGNQRKTRTRTRPTTKNQRPKLWQFRAFLLVWLVWLVCLYWDRQNGAGDTRAFEIRA